MFKGIPVYGSVQIAHIGKDGKLRTLIGEIVPNLHKQIKNYTKKLTNKEAIQIAEKDLSISNFKYVNKPTATLSIYQKGGQTHLVYQVELNYVAKQPGRWMYFIDATNGKIVHKFNNLHFERVQGEGTGVLGDKKILNTELENGVYSLVDTTRKDSGGSIIKTYDGQNSPEYPDPSTPWADNDNKFNDSYDAPAVDAHYYVGITYDYFKEKHGRNGIDGIGTEIRSIVHYDQGYNNAYWDGEYMVFGDGDGEIFRPLSGGIDVVAHELTHGVTEHSAGLIYENESGALNEAISDIFGTLVEFYNKSETTQPDWLMGEDVYTPNISNDALRSLENPADLEYTEGEPYPDHYSKRYRGIDDNGGVHINSSIINKAAYLISEGGTHYGVTVEGIGQEKLGKILYRTLTQYLTPMSNFHQFRAVAIQAVIDLYPNGTEADTVKAAFEAVGIEGPKNAEPLKVDGTYKGAFKFAGETKWFTVDPASVVSTKSHILFEVSGVDATVTVYPNQDYAELALSYAQFTDKPQSLEFPIAWKGPYYVKVTSNEDGNFELTTTPVYKQPVEHQEGQECLTELAAKEEMSISKQLANLRAVRDHLLGQSEDGQAITSLYYSISKEAANDFLFNSQFRKAVINDLKKLQSVIYEAGKIANGQASSYTLTDQDYEALLHLKRTIEEKVPNRIKEQINIYWNKLELKKETNVSLTNVLKRLNISATNAGNAELIVKFKENTSKQQALEKVKQALSGRQDVEKVGVRPLANGKVQIADTYVVTITTSSPTADFVKALQSMKGVAYAEPNYQVHALATDVQYLKQWSLKNTGQTGGKANADINYEGAVSQLEGKSLQPTTIAVLDTGVNYELQDLANVVDTTLDYDFINGDPDAMDDNFHGTHVSGIIAAATNNGYSMTGINRYAKILPIKVLDSDGFGTIEGVAAGIRYAVDSGAKVINLSLGAESFSKTIEEALQYAYTKGVTIIAAAGNSGKGGVDYPASSKYAIAVGATDANDQLASFSNYSKKIEIVAPGVLVPSLTPYGEVELASGTSMATPHVAAVAGLIYSLKNNAVSPDQVRQLFRNNSVDLGDKGFDIYYGYGRLDAAKVVAALIQLPTPAVNDIDDNDTVVTGASQPGLIISVMKDTTVLGEGKVENNGKFKVNIRPQKAGTKLTIYAKNPFGARSSNVSKTVLDKTAPAAPQVNQVTDKDTKVTGTTEAGAKVVVKVGTTKLGETTAGKDGKFTVNIKVQKAGSVLEVTSTDTAGNTSPATKVTVKDQTAPAAPQVNRVTDKDTKITGTTEAGAKVVVKVGTTKLGEAKAGKDGKFTVNIKAQKAGSVLEVTSTDTAGNTSPATKVKVQPSSKSKR